MAKHTQRKKSMLVKKRQPNTASATPPGTPLATQSLTQLEMAEVTNNALHKSLIDQRYASDNQAIQSAYLRVIGGIAASRDIPLQKFIDTYVVNLQTGRIETRQTAAAQTAGRTPPTGELIPQQAMN